MCGAIVPFSGLQFQLYSRSQCSLHLLVFSVCAKAPKVSGSGKCTPVLYIHLYIQVKCENARVHERELWDVSSGARSLVLMALRVHSERARWDFLGLPPGNKEKCSCCLCENPSRNQQKIKKKHHVWQKKSPVG